MVPISNYIILHKTFHFRIQHMQIKTNIAASFRQVNEEVICKLQIEYNANIFVG